MRARKSRVPTPMRIRAKTSFQALLFTDRATSAHSNPAVGPFNSQSGRVLRNRARAPARDRSGRSFVELKHEHAHDYEGHLPPCAPQRSALTVPNLMRSFLRRAGLILALGSLACFLSCERHHPDELHSAHNDSKAPGGDHHHAAGDQHAASHASPSPAARSTPANFFPDKPKP